MTKVDMLRNANNLCESCGLTRYFEVYHFVSEEKMIFSEQKIIVLKCKKNIPKLVEEPCVVFQRFPSIPRQKERGLPTKNEKVLPYSFVLATSFSISNVAATHCCCNTYDDHIITSVAL